MIFGVTTYNQPLQYEGYITSEGHSSGTVFLEWEKVDANIPYFDFFANIEVLLLLNT